MAKNMLDHLLPRGGELSIEHKLFLVTFVFIHSLIYSFSLSYCLICVSLLNTLTLNVVGHNQPLKEGEVYCHVMHTVFIMYGFHVRHVECRDEIDFLSKMLLWDSGAGSGSYI